MHSAKLDTSQRLKRVAQLLRDGREHRTLDTMNAAKVCAVNSIISELRDNGLRTSEGSARGRDLLLPLGDMMARYDRDRASVWRYDLRTTGR